MSRVIIEVRGGVASVVEQPADVEVVIRDYDVEGDSYGEISSDENGDDMIESVSVHTPAEELPRFFECGGCDHLHPFGWGGDCRDDERRYSLDRLDDDYGERGWVTVSESTGLPSSGVYGADMGDAGSTEEVPDPRRKDCTCEAGGSAGCPVHEALDELAKKSEADYQNDQFRRGKMK